MRRSTVLNYSYNLKMTFIPIFIAILARELLLKGKAQYGSTPCTNQFRSVHFYIKIFLPLLQNKIL